MLVVLGAEVYPKMPRKKSKAVPEGNGPDSQDTSRSSGRIKEIRRLMFEALDKCFDNFYVLKSENPKEIRATDQRLAGLEHDAWQPRLAAEADAPTDKKARNRAEDAAVDQAKHGDSCSAKRVDAGPPMCLTSFGDDSTEPPALPCCRNDAMVVKDAATPKPSLSSRRCAR